MSSAIEPNTPTLRLTLTHNRGMPAMYEFRQARLTIRRRAKTNLEGDILLADRTVSRKHVVIEWRGKNYWVTDEGSLTGTIYNGSFIGPGEWWPLNSGSLLAFGETQAMVELSRPDGASEFDVFLCHNAVDRPRVRQLAADLRKHGINPWLDETHVEPATNWLPQLSAIMLSVGNAIILWGPSGFGRWQKREVECLDRMQVEQKVRLIPVILEETVKDPEWSIFLDAIHRVDFRKSTPDPVRQLVEVLRRPRA